MENTNINTVNTDPAEIHFTEADFRPVPQEERNVDKIYRPLSTFLKDALYRFKKNRLGLVGIIIIFIMILIAIFGPMLSPYDINDQNIPQMNQTPSSEHWMGTDNLGRDICVRVMYGARVSLKVGFLAALVAFAIGATYGVIAGYCGGWVDTIMMRIIEIIDSVPQTLYIILLITVWGRSMTNVYLVIGLTGWIGTARTVRGEVLSLKTREYIMAAQISNVKPVKIMFKHLVTNAIAPILVSLTLCVPSAIFLEAYLQFIGLGIVTEPSWGALASEGLKYIKTFPHMLIFPSLFISVTILAFNFVGDALRDALDPKM